MFLLEYVSTTISFKNYGRLSRFLMRTGHTRRFFCRDEILEDSSDTDSGREYCSEDDLDVWLDLDKPRGVMEAEKENVKKSYILPTAAYKEFLEWQKSSGKCESEKFCTIAPAASSATISGNATVTNPGLADTAGGSGAGNGGSGSGNGGSDTARAVDEESTLESQKTVMNFNDSDRNQDAGTVTRSSD